MDESTDTLSSDWDIVNPSLEEESTDKEVMDAQTQCTVQNLESTPVASKEEDGIHDPEMDNNILRPQANESTGSCVQDVPTQEDMESNNSSDVDVIEETVETQNAPFYPMEYSISSSLETSSPLPSEAASPPETSAPESVTSEQSTRTRIWQILELIWNLILRFWPSRDLAIGLALSLTLTVIVHVHRESNQTDVDKIKNEMMNLKSQNEELKHQVLSKIEEDKLFLVLEEQVKALKGENGKLRRSLQELISKLEALHLPIAGEKSDPHKAEIERLKEKVNLLQIDNEDLQSQLVKIRYGQFSPNTERHSEGKREKHERGDERDSDEVTEEIRELRRKLGRELAKLEEWKDSVGDMIRQLTARQHHNGNKSKFGWSWKDLKRNLKGTLPNINMSEVFSKYSVFDRKHMGKVMDSLGHYYEKAQEKTKRILSYDRKKMKNQLWGFVDSVRKKWEDARDEFFERNFRTSEADYERGSEEEERNEMKNKPPRRKGENSWLFERAAHRSEERKGDEEDTNWFLRRNRF